MSVVPVDKEQASVAVLQEPVHFFRHVAVTDFVIFTVGFSDVAAVIDAVGAFSCKFKRFAATGFCDLFFPLIHILNEPPGIRHARGKYVCIKVLDRVVVQEGEGFLVLCGQFRIHLP